MSDILSELELHFGDMKIYLPNNLFSQISNDVFEGKGDARKISFTYAYLAINSMLYKYATYVTPEKAIGNGDLKEILGYSKTTKSVDSIIKKDGLLDKSGITFTSKNFPIGYSYSNINHINKIPVRDMIMFDEVDEDVKNVLKNVIGRRKYEVKIPNFIHQQENSTLYFLENTHELKLSELKFFIEHESLSLTDFFLYMFLKSRGKNNEFNKTNTMTYEIMSEITSMSTATLQSSLEKLDELKLIGVSRGTYNKKKKRNTNNKYYWRDTSKVV